MSDNWISGPRGIVRKSDIVSIEKINSSAPAHYYNIVAFANNRQIILYSSIGENDARSAMNEIMKQLKFVEQPVVQKKTTKSESSDDENEKDVPPVSKSKKRV